LRARSGAGAPGDAEQAALVLCAVDPAQPYGAALPWPKAAGDPDDGSRARRRPARTAGAYVVLVGGDPVIYVERGGKALQTLVTPGDARLTPALTALADHVRSGRLKRLALERVDGESAMASSIAPELTALGFQEGPRRLTLNA
jgi:ATP-dependent Lhr-like helicase